MDIRATQPRIDIGGGTVNTARRPQNPEEAAKQFEEILARQMVQEMTRGMFKTSLAGDDGPGWMEGYADTQRDMLNNVLAGHLVESGSLHISEMLVRQWTQRSEGESE